MYNKYTSILFLQDTINLRTEMNCTHTIIVHNLKKATNFLV